MQFLKFSLIVGCFSLFCRIHLSLAQTTHFSYDATTGNNAIVAIPTAANPNLDGQPLVAGDEIGVFANDTLCVGATVWDPAQNGSITVWGDNGQTSQLDGIATGDTMRFKIWKKVEDKEYSQVTVTYSQGDGKYVPNGIFILSGLSATIPTAVGETPELGIPEQFSLEQNYPNPFNPATTIEYALPNAGRVTLKVYNLLGEEVAALVDDRLPAGYYKVRWIANGLTSGVYFYRLQAGDIVRTRRLILLK